MPQHPKQPNNYQKEREEFGDFLKEKKVTYGELHQTLEIKIADYWIARLEAQRQEYQKQINVFSQALIDLLAHLSANKE